MKELYTIKQGNHYASGINVKLHSGLGKLSFSITPDENCLYDLKNNNNYDINKFYGITWGLDPGNNSFRIGWNCHKQNGLIQWFYYIHNHGIRTPAPGDPYDKTLLFEAPAGIEQKFDILFDKSTNRIIIDTPITPLRQDIYSNSYFNFQNVPTWGRYNYPYFGGDQTAPHYMTTIIKNHNKILF